MEENGQARSPAGHMAMGHATFGAAYPRSAGRYPGWRHQAGRLPDQIVTIQIQWRLAGPASRTWRAFAVAYRCGGSTGWPAPIWISAPGSLFPVELQPCMSRVRAPGTGASVWSFNFGVNAAGQAADNRDL